MRRRADGIGHCREGGDARGVGGALRSQQALDVAFGRRGERGDRRHFGHREGAIEGVDRTQQTVVDGAVPGPRLRQPGIDGFQVAADLGAQDVEQDRIDLDRDGGGQRRGQRRGGRACIDEGRGQVEHDLLAGGEAIGHALHRREVDADRGLAAQGGMQLRQDFARLADEGDDFRAGRTGAIQHAVEHVLDVPAELAEDLGAHQPATALQGMEHAADRAQLFGIVRRAAPGRQQLVEVADLFLELLQEDFADFVVDLVACRIEARAERRRVGLAGDHRRGDQLGRFRLRCRWRSLRHGRGVDLDRVLGRCIARCVARDRPVTEAFQAATRLRKQVLARPVRIAQRLEEILHARQRIRQRVELASAGHLAAADQLGLAVAPQRIEVARRLRQLEHAHRTGDLGQQARHRLERGVVPIGFHEGHEGVADLGEIRRGLARKRTHDLARFLREQVLAVVGIALPEAGDLGVERMVDLDQRTRDFQQRVLARRTRAACDRVQDAALLAHHAARGLQAHHAEGFADPLQRVGLRLQFADVAQPGPQVQVQGVLDPQQVFLQRRGHGVQQGAVAPGQAAARMFDLRLGRFFKQLRQRILAQRAFAARRAQLVEQRQQHDRNVAVPALQAFQVVRQLHHAAHQRRAHLVAVGGGAALERARQLLHFAGDHRRRMQLQHAQGALHLVQVAGAGAHAFAVFRRFGEGLDLEPRLAQGLVDLGLHPAERGVVDGIPERRGHRDAPVMPRTHAGRAWTVLFIPTSTSAIRPAA